MNKLHNFITAKFYLYEQVNQAQEVLGELKSRCKEKIKAARRTKNIANHEVNQGKNKSHAKTGLVARIKTTAKTA
jgi:hypothetical protein